LVSSSRNAFLLDRPVKSSVNQPVKNEKPALNDDHDPINITFAIEKFIFSFAASNYNKNTKNTQFLFNQPIFPQLLQVSLLQVRPAPTSIVLGIVVAELLQAGCPSCCSINSIKALKDDKK